MAFIACGRLQLMRIDGQPNGIHVSELNPYAAPSSEGEPSQSGAFLQELSHRLAFSALIRISFDVFSRRPLFLLVCAVVGSLFSAFVDPLFPPGSAWWKGVVYTLVYAAVSAVPAVPIIRAVEATVMRRPWSLGQTLKPIRGIGLAMLANLAWYVVVMLGTLALVVPGIIAGTYCSFAIQVAVLHQARPMKSFAWSAALVRGNFLHVFFISFLVPFALSFAADAAVSSVAASWPGSPHWVMLPADVAVQGPLWLYNIVVTVLFLNLSMVKAAGAPGSNGPESGYERNKH
jgi:hypothetical protein